MYNKIESNNIDNSFGAALQKAPYNIIKNNNNVSIINTNKSKQIHDKKINELNILV